MHLNNFSVFEIEHFVYDMQNTNPILVIEPKHLNNGHTHVILTQLLCSVLRFVCNFAFKCYCSSHNIT